MTLNVKPRLSGHETFTFRYAWLPKIVADLSRAKPNRELFKHEGEAMVSLGVGKNMVKSMRFWAEASGVISVDRKGEVELTPFGQQLFGHDGHDMYLEEEETLWLLHWKISSATPRLHYWEQILNFWHRSEFSASELIPFLRKALPENSTKPSDRTLRDGFRVFVNTYVPTRNKKGDIGEENLDSPLSGLGLIKKAGQRGMKGGDGIREMVYNFDLREKDSISDQLFAYTLADYWLRSEHSDDALPFRYVCSGIGSPGQIFKLPENAIRSRIDRMEEITEGSMKYTESTTMQQVVKNENLNIQNLLDAIYISESPK